MLNGSVLGQLSNIVSDILCNHRHQLQRWPKKFVLGCMNSSPQSEAGSRNLGQTFLANSVASLHFDATHPVTCKDSSVSMSSCAETLVVNGKE